MAEVGKAGKRQLTTEVITVDPSELVLLKENARFMAAEVFKRLVENIKRDGCLSSTPLVYRIDGGLRVLSGNHRTMAAKEAGLTEIQAMEITTQLTEDELRAIQLSHNALNGEDRLDILKAIWDKMQSVDAKMYAGLGKQMLEKLELPPALPVDARLNFEQVTLLFVGDEKEEVETVLKEVRKRGLLSKENWLETLEGYKEVTAAIQLMCEKENIHNYTTAVVLLARCAAKYMAMADEQEKPAGEVIPATRSASS